MHGVDNKPHETSIRALIGMLFTLALPLMLVKGYRRIPAQWRGVMFPGSSTSHLAIQDMANGVNGWTAIRRHSRIKW